ncbi:D-glycerate dehydrogenase [Brevibacillus sp. AY1]|uniref:2-hydroxyacid dehydrogenase n=1 Tax=Brevibacillus sp. AY1 TaxID=2807621 RepID=UPI00245906E6|nr:D-glycerate dehydrogenase [Brevibacillus sp. AY1]MDH4619847.1 D-glycerate dehydrogenase [Brevibacillus sp. AY1]
MRPKVYITRRIPESAVAKLRESCEMDMWDETDVPVPREVLVDKIQAVDGLLCMLTETIDEDLLTRAKQLSVVSNMAVGFNNIDVDAATTKGILVTNTPGVLTETTADLTFALLMATARRIVEASDYVRKGNWKAWSPMQMTGQDIYGATMGIIGLGRIGEALAKRAKGFDMHVLYYNRNRKENAEKELGLEYASLERLLQVSDYVCVLAPYTPHTRNLIDKRELSLMKPTAILINTARGGIVNEAALYEALRDNKLWAAGLDVFEQEPVSLDHPLLTLPNVVTLPHIGSASIQTRTRMAELAAANLLQGVSGQMPTHLVNKDVRGLTDRK